MIGMKLFRGIGLAAYTGLTASTACAQVEYECTVVDAFASSYTLRETYFWDINDAGMSPGLTTIAHTLPGGSVSITYTGFYWTPGGGKVAVDIFPRGVNNHGLLVGGASVLDTATSAITPMPPLGGWGNVQLHGVNDAGVAVGYLVTCNCSNSQGTNQIPYVWDATGGARTIGVAGAKELLRINNAGWAVGNIRSGSADGFVHDLNTGATTTMNAFLVPSSASSLVDINEAGTALGETASVGAPYAHAFLWSAAAGARYLPDAPAGFQPDLKPRGLNGAETVVGWMYGGGSTRAFVWDEAKGVRDLNTVTSGIPAGFVLTRAMRINEQGWIVGDGQGGGGFSRAFVLRPVAGTCYPDCNADGSLTVADFGCFQTRFVSGDPGADCTQDGALTVADFGCFQSAFVVGCP